MRRVALLFLWVAVCAFGVRAPHNSTKQATGYALYLTSDTHSGRVVGGSWASNLLLAKIVAYVNADPEAVGLVHCGDFTWYSGGISTEQKASVDSAISILDSLDVPLYPVIGNWDYDNADTASGNLYDGYAAKWAQGFFAPYTSTSKRGRRWYGKRLRHGNNATNGLLFVTQNVSNESGDYYVNNPQDGSGVSLTDFDGHSVSWSAQRNDLRWFMNNVYQTGDVLFVAGHRTMHLLASIGIRPEISPQDTSAYVGELDADLGAYWFALMGDEHTSSALGLINRGGGSGGHYSAGASMAVRLPDSSQLTAYGDTVKWLYTIQGTSTAGDTIICSGCAAVDSMGADGASAPQATAPGMGQTTLHRFEVNGTTVTHSVIIIRLWDTNYEGFTRTVKMAY